VIGWCRESGAPQPHRFRTTKPNTGHRGLPIAYERTANPDGPSERLQRPRREGIPGAILEAQASLAKYASMYRDGEKANSATIFGWGSPTLVSRVPVPLSDAAPPDTY
jgi:hypothetical protein